MRKQKKLNPSKWRLFYLRLKYYLLDRRPIPWLSQKFCEECRVVYNKDILDECPLCGRGPNIVWLVAWHNQIERVCRDPKDAAYYKALIEIEGGGQAEIQRWRVQ